MDAWGKFESSDCFHRLEHHCADVAACFEALLAEPVLRARFEQASGAGSLSDTTVARLTVLAFLHDFGKLNSGFQFKVRERSELPNGAPPKAAISVRRCSHRAKSLKRSGSTTSTVPGAMP